MPFIEEMPDLMVKAVASECVRSVFGPGSPCIIGGVI